MNWNYLMQHVSRHLHTFIRRYSYKWNLLDAFCARENFQDDHLEPVLKSYFSSPCVPDDIPIFLSLGSKAVYAKIPSKKLMFILGPVSFSDPVYIRRQKPDVSLCDNLIEQIPACAFGEFMTDIMLIFNLCREESMSEETVLEENCIQPGILEDISRNYTDYIFEKHESGKTHNPYDQELREFTSIENGDILALQKSLSEDYPGEIGTLAQNSLRQMKNRGIVVIALASRAAIRGGILPEISYSLSDSYIQKIETCSDVNSVKYLFHAAEYQYTQLVAELKTRQKACTAKSNIHIENCKTYIYSHLHEKIRIKEIASELNINANYLSELFHNCEGITITEYIHKEKIQMTKNLLIYSHYTYSEIAAYLGYSSQSHLGKAFKQHTGMTMCQYRTKFGVRFDKQTFLPSV